MSEASEQFTNSSSRSTTDVFKSPFTQMLRRGVAFSPSTSDNRASHSRFARFRLIFETRPNLCQTRLSSPVKGREAIAMPFVRGFLFFQNSDRPRLKKSLALSDAKDNPKMKGLLLVILSRLPCGSSFHFWTREFVDREILRFFRNRARKLTDWSEENCYLGLFEHSYR